MAKGEEEKRPTKLGEWLSYWLAAVVLIPVGLALIVLALWVVWLPADPGGEGVDRRTPAFVLSLVTAGMLMAVLGSFSTRVENFSISLKGLRARLRKNARRRIATAKDLAATDAPARAQEERLRAPALQDAQLLEAALRRRATKKKSGP